LGTLVLTLGYLGDYAWVPRSVMRASTLLQRDDDADEDENNHATMVGSGRTYGTGRRACFPARATQFFECFYDESVVAFTLSRY